MLVRIILNKIEHRTQNTGDFTIYDLRLSIYYWLFLISVCDSNNRVKRCKLVLSEAERIRVY
jgi:hypothetical protein